MNMVLGIEAAERQPSCVAERWEIEVTPDLPDGLRHAALNAGNRKEK